MHIFPKVQIKTSGDQLKSLHSQNTRLEDMTNSLYAWTFHAHNQPDLTQNLAYYPSHTT